MGGGKSAASEISVAQRSKNTDDTDISAKWIVTIDHDISPSSPYGPVVVQRATVLVEVGLPARGEEWVTQCACLSCVCVRHRASGLYFGQQPFVLPEECFPSSHSHPS